MDHVLESVSVDRFAAAWLEARGFKDAADAVRRFNSSQGAREVERNLMAAE
jgi:hypothetical protein